MVKIQRVNEIAAFVQGRLRAEGLHEVRALQAAKWLDAAGLLRDSRSRPGLPLRSVLRGLRDTGTLMLLPGACQKSNRSYGRWWIKRIERRANNPPKLSYLLKLGPRQKARSHPIDPLSHFTDRTLNLTRCRDGALLSDTTQEMIRDTPTTEPCVLSCLRTRRRL